MRRILIKNVHFNKFFLLKTSLLLLCGTITYSCGNKSPTKPSAGNSHDIAPVPPVITSGTAKPVVIPVTAANAPVVIKAGAPFIEKDSLHGGAPFLTNFTSDDGLGSSGINCIIQDRLGNIWFGTQSGGASRYDGKSFTNYTTAQGLGGNTINCMLQDNAGDIWFGTSGGGVSRYDGKTFDTYTMGRGLGGNIVHCMLQDKAGNILVASENAGISRFAGDKFVKYSTASELYGKNVTAMLQDKAGRIWFGTNVNGAVIYDGKKATQFTKTQGLTGNDVLCLDMDKDGNIWIGTEAGATRYGGTKCKTYTTSDGLAANYISQIAIDKKGNLWFAAGNKGVSRYDGKTFITYGKAQGLTDNNVQALCLDKNGSIWLGYGSSGAARYDGDAFKYFTPKIGQVGTFGNKIFEDRSGNIWFGTLGQGVIRYDGKTLESYTHVQGLAGDYVWGIAQDRDGNLWFGTNAGASKYNGQTFTNYNTAQGLPGNNVFAIRPDRAGNIWFGTWNSGVGRFDGKRFTNYTTQQGLAFNIVDNIIQDAEDNIWFSSGKGVSRFNGRTFTNYAVPQGLAGNVVLSMLQDKSGNIWFGADNAGISRWDGTRFANNDNEHWLDESGEVYAINQANDGKMLWFGTTHGLALVNPAISAINRSSRHFDLASGYPLKDVFSLLVDKKGIIWTECGDNRIIRFDYGQLNTTPAHLHLQIKGVKINGLDMCWNALLPKQDSVQDKALRNEMGTTFGKILSVSFLDSLRNNNGNIKFDSLRRFYPVPTGLVLPYADRNVTISFIGIAPDFPKQVKYSYQLAGYDNEWSVPSEGTTAIFGNIPEGSYTFTVKAITPYGILGSAQYSFKVLPPWYRAWFAWICYVILIVGGIWGIIRLRSGQLIRQKRELEQTVQLRTGEVLQQRNHLEQAFHELKNTQAQLIQAEKMASLGQLTTGIAHEIQNPLNFVNNFSDVNTEMIDEMQEELRLGNMEEVFAIIADIRENEKKIGHHGRRAESIVKGMLAHGRAAGSAIELTDINKLGEEYLHLAYMQLRTKDPSFEAELLTQIDPGLPKIELIAADMGRVLLNLFNNAFYAVNEKRRTTGSDYHPIVSFITGVDDSKVRITIKDNATGIPAGIADKIMQPFFTTKPPGEGVGMGLSLAYDIIVNAYKGKLEFESIPGEGSVFMITLPLNM